MPQVVISNFPQNITTEEFSIQVFIDGAKDGKNYLRVEIYKEGSKNYFGETFNGTSWYGGSDGLSYFPIEIKSGSGSAILKARVGEVSNNEFNGSGDCKLKVKRYTQSGNAASDIENAVNIKINLVIASASLQPSAEPIATPEMLEATPVKRATVLTNTKTSIFKNNATPQVLSYETSIPSPEIYTDKEIDTFSILPALAFAFGLFLIGINIYLIYNGLHVSGIKKNH